MPRKPNSYPYQTAIKMQRRREEIREQAKAELARRELIEYITRMYPGFQRAHHHEYICEQLQKVESGEITRLMIFCPPRHSKSLIVSQHFPAWYLGRNPGHQVIITSYGASLAEGFSRKARNQIRYDPDWPFPQVKMAPDAQGVEEWHVQSQVKDKDGHIDIVEGVCKAAGVGGPISGKGADLLVIDDPIKDRAEADSEVMRKRVLEWYQDVARTRLQPGGRIVLMCTRWHEDDLPAHLIAQQAIGGEQWIIINLPALAEKEDLLGRAEGEALWPEWFPVEALDAVRGGTTARTFAALYQQSPTQAGGNIFKRDWFVRRYHTLPGLQEKIQTVDGAWETGVGNDYSVIATWGTDGVDYFVIDRWRARVEMPDLKMAVIDQYNKHRPSLVLIEDSASGKAAIQSLRRESSIPILPIKPIGTKIARAEAVAPTFETMKVRLPDDADWVSDFVEEHVSFPSAAHDDQVDTTSMALKRLALATPPGLDFLRQENLRRKAREAAGLKPTPPRLGQKAGLVLPGMVGR